MASKGGLTICLAAALALLWASSAQAATTRAEWVGQVEPICQAVLPAAISANADVNRKSKNLVKTAKHGSNKAFVRAIRALARSLQAYTAIDDNLTGQLAAVPPVATDAAAVSNWLQGRRNTTALANSAAQALTRFKLNKYFKLLDQANAAYNEAVSSVSAFGLNACLTA